MRKFRKPGKGKEEEVTSEDTQEMFTQGADRNGEPSELDEEATREYENPDMVDSDEDLETGDVEFEDEEEFPDEDWDEDLEDELDENLDEGPEGSPDAHSAEKPSAFDGLKAWFVELGVRARALWSRLISRIGEIRLPRHEVDGQKVLAVAGIALVSLLVGAAGYLLGRGSGEDIDTARLEGEAAGKQAGAVAGATRGYAAGFKKGRDRAFERSYSSSYRRNYIRAYENAGMDPPDRKDIEVPEP